MKPTISTRRLPLPLLAGLMIVAVAAWLAPAAVAITDADIAAIGRSSAAVADAPPAAQVQSPSLAAVIGRMTLALGIVLGLMGGVLWAARRALPKAVRAARGGPIEILSSRALGGRKSLLLVKARDKTVLLGVSSQGIHFLTEVDQDPPVWADTALDANLGGESPAGVAPAREGF